MNKRTLFIQISLLVVFLLISVIVNNRQILFDLRSRALGIPANIVVDKRETLIPFNTSLYHAFSQGGEESSDMIAPVLAEVKNLSPQFIRIDHIFDAYRVVSRRDGTLVFDFDRLDQIIASIRKTGATPLLSLSYMPDAIAKDGVIINPPDNWNDWTLVIQKTIEHVSGRNGLNISGVSYEVWNEPDLAQFGGWKTYGDKNYITLYRLAAEGAANARNTQPFSLGGPATTGLYKNWVTTLIESGARVDFISWHTYDPDPNRFRSDEKNLTDWLSTYPSHRYIPRLITEFGLSGAKDARYGSPYASAYTASVIRTLLDSNTTHAFTFQLKDGTLDGSTQSGWGLMTHESQGKKLKPRYQVFRFLDSMAGTRVSLSGEGTWVTGFATVDEHVTKLLLINFDVHGNHVELVPITIQGLTTGVYNVTKSYFLGTQTTTTEEVLENAPLTQTVYMPSHSIVKLEITKQ